MSPDLVDLQLSTRLLYGRGSVSSLGRLCREHGATRVLCVTDPGVAAAGHVDRCLESLQEAGIAAEVYRDVRENPTTRDVEDALAAARRAKMDFLVAVGGGSAMDCTKGINFLYSCGGTMKDYWGKDRATGPLLGTIAIPTTAGTGSDVQSFALISDAATHQKMACGDPRAAARVALLDPDLTLTLPRSVTAVTGLDAVSHAVETFVTKARTPVSRELSRDAWMRLSRNLPRVLERSSDIEARGHMLLGASLAGAAIEHSMLGAAHSAANPISARKDIPHGLAVAIMLPHVVRYNEPSAIDDYRELLEAAQHPESDTDSPGTTLALWLEGLLAATGLPTRLREVGFHRDDLGLAAEEAEGQWTAQFNPRPVKAEDFRALYDSAF